MYYLPEQYTVEVRKINFNATNLGLMDALSDCAVTDKLPNGVSTMLVKELEVSARIVRKRYAYCKKQYAIQQQIMRAERAIEYGERELRRQQDERDKRKSKVAASELSPAALLSTMNLDVNKRYQ